MTVTQQYLLYGAVALVAGYFLLFKTRLLNELSTFIPSVEGFSPTPYWDVSRWSWGYGTAAPGQTGTISREAAFDDMVTYLMHDYGLLKQRITRSLSVKQWAALLSFSYNLGIGNAYNLIDNINNQADQALRDQWAQYVHAGGVVNQDLVARRNKELALWFS